MGTSDGHIKLKFSRLPIYILYILLLNLNLIPLAFSTEEDCPWFKEPANSPKVPINIRTNCQCGRNPSSNHQLSIQCQEIQVAGLVSTLKNINWKLEPLELLYLNNSQITGENGQVPSRTFKDIKMSSLQISNCGIKSFHSDSFRGQESNLKHLSLTGNQLVEIPRVALERLNNLHLLDLSFNKITKVPAGTFEKFGKLSTLKLNDNNLILEKGSFWGLELSLRNLNLKGTRLSTIPISVSNLSSLAFLDLAQNRIRDLDPEPLRNLHSLTALNLERNLLQSLPEDAFEGVNDTLSSLSLLNNLITGFPRDALEYLYELRVLDLGFNLLTELPANAFHNLNSLTLLALDGNPLSTIPEGLFSHLANTLRGLSLGGRFLNCDCRMRWVIDWIHRYDLQVTSRERNPQFCGSPSGLKSVNTFYQLKTNDLICNSSSSGETSTSTTTGTSTTISSTSTSTRHSQSIPTLLTSTSTSKYLNLNLPPGDLAVLGINENVFGATNADAEANQSQNEESNKTSEEEDEDDDTDAEADIHENQETIQTSHHISTNRIPVDGPQSPAPENQEPEPEQPITKISLPPIPTLVARPTITRVSLTPTLNLKPLNKSVTTSTATSTSTATFSTSVHRPNPNQNQRTKPPPPPTRTFETSSSPGASAGTTLDFDDLSKIPVITGTGQGLSAFGFPTRSTAGNIVRVTTSTTTMPPPPPRFMTTLGPIILPTTHSSPHISTGTGTGTGWGQYPYPGTGHGHGHHNHNHRPPNLIFADPKPDIQLEEIQRAGDTILVQWVSAKPTGFRIIYRLFGEDTFRHGPPLAPTEREYRIPNVPYSECIVVCVVPYEEIVYNEISPMAGSVPPGSQCRELKPTSPSALMNHMDKITIGASAAICICVLLAVVIFIGITKRAKRKRNREPSIIATKVPPSNSTTTNSNSSSPIGGGIIGNPTLNLHMQPPPTLHSHHSPNKQADWDQMSGLSNRSIPRARLPLDTLPQRNVHVQNPHSHSHHHQHHNHTHNHRPAPGPENGNGGGTNSRSYLSSHHAHHNHSMHSYTTSTTVPPAPNHPPPNNNPHPVPSGGMNTYLNNQSRLLRASLGSKSSSQDALNKQLGPSGHLHRHYEQNKGSISMMNGGSKAHRDRRSHGGGPPRLSTSDSLNTLSAMSGYETPDNWTDHDLDVYVARNHMHTHRDRNDQLVQL